MELFEFKNLEDANDKLGDELLTGTSNFSPWPGVEGVGIGFNPDETDLSKTPGIIIMLSEPQEDIPTCVITQEGIFPIYSLLTGKFQSL
jgi:hypothetical protein